MGKSPRPNALPVTKDKEYKHLEPDEWYLGEFEDSEVGAGKFGAYIKMTFRVLKGEYEDGSPAKGCKITRLMDATVSPSSLLWKWASVMMKREPKVGEKLDLTAYYGDKFRMLIKDKKPAKGDTNPKRYQQVDTIKRLKKKVA